METPPETPVEASVETPMETEKADVRTDLPDIDIEVCEATSSSCSLLGVWPRGVCCAKP